MISKTWKFSCVNYNKKDVDDIMNDNFSSILYKKSKDNFEGIVTLKVTSRETKLSKKYPKFIFTKSSSAESKELYETDRDYIFETRNDTLTRLLKEKNEELLRVSSSITTTNEPKNIIINKTINNTINNTMNIIINKYSTPDVGHITDHDYHESMIKPRTAFPLLVKKIHFNPSVPQNLSIKHGNKQSNTLSAYNGNVWESFDKDEVIDRVIEHSCVQIEGCVYDENFIEKYPNSKEEYDNFANFFDDEDEVNDIKISIDRVMYDNNKLVPLIRN